MPWDAKAIAHVSRRATDHSQSPSQNLSANFNTAEIALHIVRQERCTLWPCRYSWPVAPVCYLCLTCGPPSTFLVHQPPAGRGAGTSFSMDQTYPLLERRLGDATAVDTCLCHSLCSSNLHLCSHVNSRECMCQSNNCNRFPQYCSLFMHPPPSPPPSPPPPAPYIDPPAHSTRPPPPARLSLGPPPQPPSPTLNPPPQLPPPAPSVKLSPAIDDQPAADVAQLVPLQLPDSAPPVMVIQSRVPLQMSVEDLLQLDAWAAQNV